MLFMKKYSDRQTRSFHTIENNPKANTTNQMSIFDFFANHRNLQMKQDAEKSLIKYSLNDNLIISKKRSILQKKRIVLQRGKGTGRYLKSSLVLTRHHIIPESVLEKFYNKMKEYIGDANQSSFLQSEIEQMLLALRSSIINSSDLTSEGQEFSMHDITGKELFNAWFSRTEVINWSDFVSTSAIDEILIWFPENLVWGPKNRSDDPGDKLDIKALEISKKNKLLFTKTYADMLEFSGLESVKEDPKAIGNELRLLRDRIKNNNNKIIILNKNLKDSKRRNSTNVFEILKQKDIEGQIEELTKSSKNGQQEFNEMNKKLGLVKNECKIRYDIISRIITNLKKIINEGKGMTPYNENDWKENEHKKK